MKPPPRLTVSQWADAYRHLSAEASAEPGRWSTARAEYQRGIMDAVSDPAVEVLVVKKSSQVGWTEILGNIVGYHMHQDPAPMLVVQPTVEMGEAWSKDRLAPMLRDTPALRELVGDARAKTSGQTLRQKSFPGGHLAIAGANSPASLASRPMRIVLYDEVDRYPPSAGREGDPVSIGKKRTATFWNRKILLGSSPTVAKLSRIDRAFEDSDQRRYWIACAHCTDMQTLRWEQVRWSNADPATSAYHCSACGAAWTDNERWEAVRHGEWRASRPFRGTAGFHISELYSPWRRIEQVVADYLAAKGSLEELKVWTNTSLGEVFEEAGEAPEWERLLDRCEDLPAGRVPAGAVVLTAGIDNQASPERLEWAVWAWGPGYESWLIDTGTIPGSPAEAATWDAMAAVLEREWPLASGGTLRIALAGADTGGQHTQGVYQQLRRLLRGGAHKIMPLKGVAGWNKASPVGSPTAVDVTAGGRKIARGLKVWTSVAVDVFKAELYRRLWLTRAEDGTHPTGWAHLPQWLSAEQVKQLVAEQLVTRTDRRGFARREWEKLRANEQLDMAVYARAALCQLGADRYGDKFWGMVAKAYPSTALAQKPAPTPKPAPAVSIVQAAAKPVAVPVSVPIPTAGARSSRIARLSIGQKP